MRSQLSLRPAVDSDAAGLVELWGSVLRRGDQGQQLDDVRQVIERTAEAPGERLVVAEADGRVVGAVHLRATTLTPLNLEPVVQAISPHVHDDYRRHGIGTALVEAAVAFAEELGIGHVATAVASGSRDSNRFMARLGLAPAALLRTAPTTTVRGLLKPHRCVAARGGRPLSQLLAARRSMRREVSSGG